MQKQAYGIYEDFEYIDRMPEPFIDASKPDSLVKGLYNRLKVLEKQRKQLYNNEAYKGFAPDSINVSKYRWHFDENGKPSEISLDDYKNMINTAFKTQDRKALEDAASYWSMRAAITSPEVQKKLKAVLKKSKAPVEPIT